MDRIEIDTWADISAESWKSLLLGNGASIAIHKEFAYPTLHSVADAKGLLATTAPIFAKLGTTDFEHVLLACWYAEHVNVALGTPSADISVAYAEVRTALIEAVHSVRRYRYYVPQRDAKEHAGASGLPRLPAAELESAVLDQLRAILRAPNLLGDMLPQAIKLDPTLDEAKITVAMTRLDAIWDQLFPAEQTRIVKLLVEKVIVSPNDLEVRLRANGIERLVLELRPEPVEQQVEALA
jgi:hypothetical protein